jgi:hypothetical protein
MCPSNPRHGCVVEPGLPFRRPGFEPVYTGLPHQGEGNLARRPGLFTSNAIRKLAVRRQVDAKRATRGMAGAGSRWVRNDMYHYRQPNLGDGKDASRRWGADRINRSLAAGQHRGSTSAFRGALWALVANRTGPKTLLLRPNWTEPDCQSPGSIPVSEPRPEGCRFGKFGLR